ncbi:alpha/beta fold hydrolase [Streptomyces nogalater]
MFDELHIDKAVLVGSQMGGSLAAWFAALRGERVDRLVLMAAGALGEAEANLTLYRLLAHRWLGAAVARIFPAASSSSGGWRRTVRDTGPRPAWWTATSGNCGVRGLGWRGWDSICG